jgi:hypothetical protein
VPISGKGNECSHPGSVEPNQSKLGVVQAMGMAAEQEADGQGDTAHRPEN